MVWYTYSGMKTGNYYSQKRRHHLLPSCDIWCNVYSRKLHSSARISFVFMSDQIAVGRCTLAVRQNAHNRVEKLIGTFAPSRSIIVITLTKHKWMNEITAIKVMAGICYVHVAKYSCLEKDHQRLWVGVLNCEKLPAKFVLNCNHSMLPLLTGYTDVLKTTAFDVIT